MYNKAEAEELSFFSPNKTVPDGTCKTLKV